MFGRPGCCLLIVLLAACSADSRLPPGPGGKADDASADAASQSDTRQVVVLAGPTRDTAAVLVDGDQRVWIAQGDRVWRLEESWVDTSAGLDGAVRDFHLTPQGELFASTHTALRLEQGQWVSRLDTGTCVSPLRLTSTPGGGLFGVCAYYSWYVSWPTRDEADRETGIFRNALGGDAWSLSDDEVYVIARDYKVPGVSVGDWRDQSTFTAVELPADVGDRAPLALHAFAEHEIIAVGEDGLILRGGRDGWTVEPSGVTEDLLEVWGSDSDGFYAVGEHGRILFRGEQGWRVVDSGTDQTLRSIHGQPGGRIVIGGDGSALLELIAPDRNRP